MTPTIVVSPNPVVRPATANAYIGGLTPGTRYNARVDASTIATARATREGTLAVGITVGAASKLGGHAVDVRDSANKVTLAAGTFAVADAPPPPPIVEVPKVVPVSSIVALKQYLVDDTVDQIDWAAGLYGIAGSGNKAPNSLWIGSEYAGRKRPVKVRTTGRVTLDLGGGYAGGISFNGGAHHQDWQGDFYFINGLTQHTGVIVLGGYASAPDNAAPHDLTLIGFAGDKTMHRVDTGTTDHFVYFSYALEGWGNIVLGDISVDASDPMGLMTAIHMDHGYPTDYPLVPAHGVTVRNTEFLGNKNPAQQAIILWTPAVHDWLFEGAKITNAGRAVRFESGRDGPPRAANVVFKDIVSTGTPDGNGFYSSMGASPPGVTIIGGSLG